MGDITPGMVRRWQAIEDAALELLALYNDSFDAWGDLERALSAAPADYDDARPVTAQGEG